MHSNEELITLFYQSFQEGDYQTMQECYADNAVFNDEVFVNLNANEVRAMWEMFCVKGKDVQIAFSNVQADKDRGSAEWIANYTFTKNGKKVINSIKAQFTLADGKIVKHTDSFSFYTWASQALGLTGMLLGWTPWIKAQVRKGARKSLTDYMNGKKDER